MPLKTLLNHWPALLGGDGDSSHEDTVAHQDHASFLPYHHSRSSSFHSDLHASFLSGPPSSRVQAGAQATAFLSLPMSSRKGASAVEHTAFLSADNDSGFHRNVEKLHKAAAEHTKHYGDVYAVGIGMLIGGAAMISAVLRLSYTQADEDDEALNQIKATKLKRARLDQMIACGSYNRSLERQVKSLRGKLVEAERRQRLELRSTSEQETAQIRIEPDDLTSRPLESIPEASPKEFEDHEDKRNDKKEKKKKQRWDDRKRRDE